MGRLESRPEEFSTQEMHDLFETVQIESLSKAEKKDYARYMTTERDIRNQWYFAMEKDTTHRPRGGAMMLLSFSRCQLS